MATSTALKYVEDNRGKLISYLQKLVRDYPEGEASLQAHLVERFTELGCQVHVEKLLPTTVRLEKEFALPETIDMIPRTHIIGQIKGNGGGRSLMLITHPDGDPIKTEGWVKPPHEGTIENGKMYGWGVADDLAGIAMMIGAVEAILTTGIKPRGDVYLMSACAKRNAWGIAALLRLGYMADAAIYVHPAESELGLREIKTLTSGLLKFRITVEGRLPPKTEFVQTTFQHLGVNSIDKAIKIILSLYDLNDKRNKRVNYVPLTDSVGRSTNLLISHFQAGSMGNLTDIPTKCTIAGSITFPPPDDIDTVKNEVEIHLESHYQADSYLRENKPQIEWIQGTQGVEIPLNHPIVEITMRALEAETGEKPFSNPLYSKSDLRTPVLISGIPNVGIGPKAGDLATTGGCDEWVDLDDYIRATKVLVRIITDWCA